MRRGGFLLAAALILLDLAGTVRFVAIATLVISWAVAERTGAMDISRRRHYLFTWLAGCLTAFVMVLGEVGVGDLVFVTILAIFYGTWGGDSRVDDRGGQSWSSCGRQALSLESACLS